MTVNLILSGKKLPVYVDLFEFPKILDALMFRRALYILVHGLPNEEFDFLVLVNDFKDREQLSLNCSRQFISTRGVRYVSAFY